jgi:small GTP-binding protein
MNSNDDSNSNLEIEILNPDNNFCDLSYKVIVIGDSGVGKSCFTIQATQDKFTEVYRTTVGFEFLSFNLRINKQVMKLQIWDTCGQEVYKSLISGLYKNCSLAIIIYSVTNRSSFQHIEAWIKELNKNIVNDVKIILVGNKSDLEKERKISYEEGKNLKIKNKLDYFIETSAKTGDNAKTVLIEAAKILYKDYNIVKNNTSKNVSNDNSQKLKKEKNNGKVKKKKKCC